MALKSLYVIRHGLAVPHGAEGYADDERPLTPRGEKRMLQVGRGLRALGVSIETVYTSPLPRALRTAEILVETLKRPRPALEIAEILRAGVAASTIEDWIHTLPQERLAIVGHNPDFSELVLRLLGAPENQPFELKKGGVAAFRFGEDPSIAELAWLAPPGLLRRIKR